MAKTKKLGMGLDLLLTAAAEKDTAAVARVNNNQVNEMFNEALKQDEAGNFLEAYYLYRRLIDWAEGDSCLKDGETPSLVSQALNNVAIILYECGCAREACVFLGKSLAVDPDNQTALSNINLLKEENSK